MRKLKNKDVMDMKVSGTITLPLWVWHKADEIAPENRSAWILEQLLKYPEMKKD